MQIEAVTIITDVSDPFGLPTSRRERGSLSRFFHQTNPNCLIFLSCCGNFLRPDETWQVLPLGSWTPVRWVNTSVLPDTHLGTSPRLKRNSRLYWTNFGIQMPDCISSYNKSKITEFLRIFLLRIAHFVRKSNDLQRCFLRLNHFCKSGHFYLSSSLNS